MAECEELEPLFAAYVDGEIGRDEGVRVQAHLAVCRLCRERLAGERTACDVLRAHRRELLSTAPPNLRQRCAACNCGPSRWFGAAASRRLVGRSWLPLSFAATLLLAVAVVFFMGLNGSVEALATQLALDHVKCFQFAPAHAEVDPNAVGEAWNHRYAWLINVPRSAPVEQLELLDVRRCLSTQGASAHIMYRWRGQPLSVYVLNSQPKADLHAERLITSVGQEAIIWADAGRTYAVVGRGQRNDLEHIAHYMRASAR